MNTIPENSTRAPWTGRGGASGTGGGRIETGAATARKSSQNGGSDGAHHPDAAEQSELLRRARRHAEEARRQNEKPEPENPARERATVDVISGASWGLRQQLNWRILVGEDPESIALWLSSVRPDWIVCKKHVRAWATSQHHQTFQQRQKVGAAMDAQAELEELLQEYERRYGFRAGGSWRRQKAVLLFGAVRAIADQVEDGEGLMATCRMISAYLRDVVSQARGEDAFQGLSPQSLYRMYTRHQKAAVEDRTPQLLIPDYSNVGRKPKKRKKMEGKPGE